MQITNYQPRIIYPDVPQLSLADYKNAIDYFVQQFCDNFSNKAAFYQFGEIRTPGISDIDLLIFVEDELWKSARSIAQSIIGTSQALSFFFVHEPLIICQSLIPYLPVIHTLENCKSLQDAWNPLDLSDVDDLNNYHVRLFRHAVWNSFIRIAALELDGAEIGMRRSLTLLHNLLASAHRGNEFLQKPVPVSLTTEEIRSNVLSAPIADQERLVKTYITQVVELLNAVDAHLDLELAPKLGFDSEYFSLFPLTKRRFILTSLLLENIRTGNYDRWSRVLRQVEIVPVPVYPAFFGAVLAIHLSDQFPEFRVYNGIKARKSSFRHDDFKIYVNSVKASASLFKTHHMDYFFPKPFSIKHINLSARDFLSQFVRRYLAKLILTGVVN